MKTLAVLAFLLSLADPARAQDALRYVTPNTTSPGGWTMWESYEAFRACIAITLDASRRGRLVVGSDPCASFKIGVLNPGIRVERLDSPACRDMVKVRVVEGALKDRTGCFPSEALTSIQPSVAVPSWTSASAVAQNDPIRYIVASPSPNGYVLWTSHSASIACVRAVVAHWDLDQFCGEGPGKPKIGYLQAGVRVERLDSTECRDMVQIRVLDGALKGAVGCTAGAALSSVKP